MCAMVVKPKVIILSLFLVTFFLRPLQVTAQQNDQPKPEFRLNAAAGRFSPSSPLYFLDGMMDNLKLALKFSTSGKVATRMNITDEKIVEMKDEIEKENLTGVTKSAKAYKEQINRVQKTAESKKFDGPTKERLLERIHQQDEAFVYLKAAADDKEGPVVHDAWSQLQTLRSKL